MDKVIAITAWNRPKYFEHTVKSLLKLNIGGWHILAVVDADGMGLQPVHDLLCNFDYSCYEVPFKQCEPAYIDACGKTRILANDMAFDLGASFVFGIEDDVELGSDTMDLIDFACVFHIFEGCHSMALSGWPAPVPGAALNPSKMVVGAAYNAFATLYQDHWWPFLRAEMIKPRRGMEFSFDYHAQAWSRRGGPPCLMPEFPRARHFGEEGTHYAKGTLDLNAPLYDGPKVSFDNHV